MLFFLACFDGSKEGGNTVQERCVLDSGNSTVDSNDTSDTGDITEDTGEGEPIRSNVCETDEECSTGGRCLSVVDVNIDVRVCQYSVNAWIHECEEMSWGCCSDEECENGLCAAMEINYCGGPPPEQENVCVSNECSSDSDCSVGSVCLDAGVLGSLTGSCIPAACTQHSDCNGVDARCSLVYDGVTCPGTKLVCTDVQSECRWYGDCDQGLCVGTDNGAWCQEEMMPP